MATVRPKLREARAASSSCSTAQRWRSRGRPRRAGGAKTSKASSKAGLTATSSPNADDFVAVGFRFRRPLKVEKARVAGRELDALVAKVSGPAADRGPSVERRLIPRELCNQDPRSLDRRRHVSAPRLKPLRGGRRRSDQRRPRVESWRLDDRRVKSRPSKPRQVYFVSRGEMH